MCEVTKYNFNEKFSEIEDALKNALFISIDCEFSALHIKKEYQGSLFDTPQKRYYKIRKNLEQAIPLEIGLTAFTFNRDDIAYTAKPYKFYLFPAHFGLMYKTFVCQSSAFHFLGEHKFDFNKFIYSGIPFLNRNQELEIKKLLDEKRLYQYCKYSLESGGKTEIDILIDIVWKWFRNERNVKEKTICDINHKNYSFIYWLHNDIRNMSKQTIWTYEENQQFKVKRVTPQEFKQLNAENSLEKQLLTTLLGFTSIFRLLSDLKKPIVGHNFLNDLILIINTFDNPVPASYNTFKDIAHNFFPSIFDTKTINFELSNCIDEKKRWKGNNGLQDLYHFFKNEGGRHLVPGSPRIEISEEFDYYADDKFHDAGWDSYCTGYCFIRMAHCFAALNYGAHVRKTFMHSELLKAVDCYKNKVNVIRATTPYLNLSGADPASQRPPCLIIQSTTCKPVDIFKVTELIRECGSVDIKPHSWGGRTAIAAVGNYGSVNRILQKFQKSTEFKILAYNSFKHSPIVRAALWSGAVVSGGVLAWIIHSQITKYSG